MRDHKQWIRLLFFGFLTTTIFTCLFIQRPRLVISPILRVDVFNTVGSIHTGDTILHVGGARFLAGKLALPTKEGDSKAVEKDLMATNGSACKEYPTSKDWSFSCSIKCPDVQLSNLQSTNVDVQYVCSSIEDENITRTQISPLKSIYSVSLNSSCLNNLIQSYCDASLPVPNLVHYIWFSKKKVNFFHFLSFVSVLKFQKPCMILIHGDALPYGEYWDYFMHLADNVVHVKSDPPLEIRGKKLGRIEHQADIARLLVLQKYGGIYLDTDEVILRSLDPLRVHNFTLSHALKDNLSNGLIMSSSNADFIGHWLNGYRSYSKAQWAYHSTILPYKLSKQYPNLIHVENKTFVRPSYIELSKLFRSNFDWTENYAIHLYIRFYKYKHDFYDIRKLNTTMGSVARHVLYNTKELCIN